MNSYAPGMQYHGTTIIRSIVYRPPAGCATVLLWLDARPRDPDDALLNLIVDPVTGRENLLRHIRLPSPLIEDRWANWLAHLGKQPMSAL